MKNKKETLLILTILITICIIIFNRDKLYEAKYTAPKDTFLAITINGEIDYTKEGIYEISISVNDSFGHNINKNTKVYVKEYNKKMVHFTLIKLIMIVKQTY